MLTNIDNFYVWKHLNNPRIVYATQYISIYKYFDKKTLTYKFKVFAFKNSFKKQPKDIDLFDIPKEINDQRVQ